MSDTNLSTLNPLDRRFAQRLQNFASKGYRFDGSDHALKPGTQYEALDGYLRGLKDGRRHGYFDIPTGVGKTAIFMSLIENYLDAAKGQDEEKRVLVVVPNVTLVKQTANAFAKFMPEIAPKLEADDDSGHPIDWARSDLGLQYGKLKHADKKPRVLVTTYASLRRDVGNKVYDPKEFGLVVYDEGHSITAEEAGKAVGKFEDALQLAVTATPDYSEDKRVGQKLAHCYYRLPLAEAINRGDLCGVRPILIKTDYTVDKAKVEEFIRANKSNSLSDAQLQELFNVEARNRSVIDTYLSERDPDSGERFLGQQGLIFSGGIRHADDLVSQFHKALGEDRFAKIRRWLEDENIEIAAVIHSGSKGAWLSPGLLTDVDGNALPNRKRQSQSEWYSEDEIRLLHEQGKILLLISDKKLREGYDCPKDNIVIDMVDRLSVLDVTQRIGRGFRLDPDDPDKVCTPINLVDANTHEIYKDRPQLLPVYAAEILEGAEFRKPMKRKLTRKFSHEIPEAEEALDHGKFEVISDQTVVHSYNNRQRREAAIAPPAPDGWMAGSAITKEYGGGNTTNEANIRALGKRKLAELLATGMDEAEASREVEEKWVQLNLKSGKVAWRVSPEGLQELIQAGKIRLTKPPTAKAGWLSGSAILRDYGGSGTTHDASIQSLGQEKLTALRDAGMDEADAAREVAEKWVQWARPNSGKDAWHVSPEGLQELIEAGKIQTVKAPPAKMGWMSGSAIAKEYGGSSTSHNASIQALGQEKIAALGAAGVDESAAAREVEDKWVQWASKAGNEAWRISPEGLQDLIQTGKVRTSRAPEAKEGWMSGSMIKRKYGGTLENHVAHIKALGEEKRAALRAAGMGEADAAREVEEKWVQWASKVGNEGWYVSPEGFQELIQGRKVRTERKERANGSSVGGTIKAAPAGEDTGDGKDTWASRMGSTNSDPMTPNGRGRGEER